MRLKNFAILIHLIILGILYAFNISANAAPYNIRVLNTINPPAKVYAY